MKAESPGKKGDGSLEAGRKKVSGEEMSSADARSKGTNVDGTFFQILKGFSLGSSFLQMAAAGQAAKHRGELLSPDPENQDQVMFPGKAQAKQRPVAGCCKGNPGTEKEGGSLGSRPML